MIRIFYFRKYYFYIFLNFYSFIKFYQCFLLLPIHHYHYKQLVQKLDKEPEKKIIYIWLRRYRDEIIHFRSSLSIAYKSMIQMKTLIPNIDYNPNFVVLSNLMLQQHQRVLLGHYQKHRHFSQHL